MPIENLFFMTGFKLVPLTSSLQINNIPLDQLTKAIRVHCSIVYYAQYKGEVIAIEISLVEGVDRLVIHTRVTYKDKGIISNFFFLYSELGKINLVETDNVNVARCMTSSEKSKEQHWS